jgi:LuxR family transcriptional regulator, maltose regulon positive regulatory protein
VIVVCASPGFGKTALLTQWRREAIAAGAAVAWLRIDALDNPQRLLAGLIQAMPDAMRKTPGAADLQPSADDLPPDEGLARWLMHVARFSGSVVLILEDVHELPAASEDSLAYLLHNAPANLRIVMASRKALPFSVSRLISRGSCSVIDAETLRLRLDETIQTLQLTFAAAIDPDSCARIHQLTEGWPLGLQLVMASLKKQQSMREALARLMLVQGDIRHSFQELLFDRLAAEDLQFLVMVSIVDDLHPDLCRILTGREDSADVLERLHASTPILGRSPGSSVLHMHAMPRTFLADMFEQLPRESKSSAHARAAEWLGEHGFGEEAARHALLGGQDESAFDLAERSLYDVLITGQVSRIASWAKHLSSEQLNNRPHLRIALGWVMAAQGKSVEVAALLSPILDDPSANLSDRFECAQIYATAAIYAGKPDAAAALFAPWRQQGRGFNPTQQQVTANIDGYLCLYGGEPEQARHILTQPGVQDSRAGSYGAGWRDWLLAYSYAWQGQLAAAERVLRVAIAEVEPVAGRRSPVASMLAVTLAAVLWNRNQLEEIDGLLADRSDVIDQYTPPDTIALSYLISARLALHANAAATAIERLDRLHVIGKERSLPMLCVVSLTEQMRIGAIQGWKTACANYFSRLQAVVSDGNVLGWGMLQDLLNTRFGLAEAYRHLVDQDWDAVRLALARTEPFAEKLKLIKEVLQIHLLDALAVRETGGDSTADLHEVLAVLQTLDMHRLLHDTHPQLPLWQMSLATKGAATTTRLQDQHDMHARGSGTAEAITARPVAPSTLLTPKEQEVLRLLANNLVNKEIASAMDISVEGVKWHMRNLFEKLNAGNRRHLLSRARMLGLLEP